MARPCGVCHRDVHDPDEHELVRAGKARWHVCKNLVLVAEQSARDLVTGERRVLNRYVPEKTVTVTDRKTGETEDVQVLDTQRTRQNHTRWAHRDTLEAQDVH